MGGIYGVLYRRSGHVFEEAQTLQDIKERKGLKEKSVPVYGIVDNQGIDDLVYSTTSVGNKKSIRNKAGMKQLIYKGGIDSFLWCLGKEMTDCMTKKRKTSWELMKVFQMRERFQDQRMKEM